MYLGTLLVGVMHFARSLRILCSIVMTSSKPRYCIITSMWSWIATNSAGATAEPNW